MSDDTTSTPEVREGQRIAKVMARAGLCSRRDAEAWIAAGRVSVNGKVLDSPAYNVSDTDDVRVDGQRLAERERTRLFLFHKPRGLVTTARDPEGRATIFDSLPPDLPRLVAIGRLDINTEGLILMTNDGGLARVLELPATGWLRRYRVRAHGRVDQAQLDRLSGGVTLDGVVYAGIEARLDREQGSNAWITMGLREGKNCEIKKVLEHLGLAVNRLIRVSFGPFELGDLAEGEVAEVRTRVLRDQLGVKLAREAGADFDAPIIERAAPVAPIPEPREERKGRREGPARERPGPGRGRDEERGRRPEKDAAPRNGPHAPSTPERRRKHISALRAEIAAGAAGPRKRIARSATQDRKGRTIAVERISPAGEEPRKRAAEVTRKPREGGAPARGERRPRRFESEREKAERPRRSREPGGPARAERRPRSFEPERETAERPRRPDSFAVKRSRDGEGRERPPRAEHEGRGARPEFKPRGPGREPRDGRPGESRSARPDGTRAKRQGDGPPRGGRDASAPAGRRPPRAAPGEGKPERAQGERGGKFTGGRPFGGKAPPGRSNRPPDKGPTKGPSAGPRRPPRKP